MDITVTFVGNATTLISAGGLTLLTDPNFLHLGGTRLSAGGRLPFGLTVTMDGRQGAELVAKLGLPTMIPVRFDDYGVFASPLADFVTEMRRRGMGDRIIELDRGASATL